MAGFLWILHRTKWRAQTVHGQDARTHYNHKTPEAAAAGTTSATEGSPWSQRWTVALNSLTASYHPTLRLFSVCFK